MSRPSTTGPGGAGKGFFRGGSLVRQHTVWLVLAFVAMELLALALFVGLAMRPLAQRAADDLAGLLVLSAQTWAELPPATRPALEQALYTQHGLRISTDPLPQGDEGWQPPFYGLLDGALRQRLGQAHGLVRVEGVAPADGDGGQTGQSGQSSQVGWVSPSGLSGSDWYWVGVPAGERLLAVGLSAERISSQPLLAVAAALLIGLAVAIALAYGLARRIATPLARLADAATRVGQGGAPDLLPEDGPAELAAVSRRFNHMAAQVRELLAARTLLLAGVSHDLRTPLARMRLALELFKTQPSASLLERLERDIEQMNQLIANVLDLARGVSQEPAREVDVAALLHELARDHSTAACQVQVVVRPAVGTPGAVADGWAWVPESSLRRALGNLLDNALRHAPVCPVELVCEWQGNALALGVLDRGPGIPVAQIEAMFQPFRRLDASRSPTTGGTGLGLAIVKELGRSHGWQVSMAPREGGGMQAWLLLSVTVPVSVSAPAPVPGGHA